MKIEAHTRLLSSMLVEADVIKTPSKEILKQYEDELSECLTEINLWYDRPKEVNLKELEKGFILLTSLFGYKPYNKTVYRVFPIKQKFVDSVKEGKTYSLKTGVRKYQSWTTSVSNAVRFHTYVIEDTTTGVFQLVSKGLEICNSDWLFAVASYLNKYGTSNIKFLAKDVLKDLHAYRKEDEVIMKLPAESKVKCVAVLDWASSKRKSIR